MINASDILHGRILIVDDQEADILLLERILRGAGYVAVTSTMKPGSVQELHRQHRYDLIMLDLQMPGTDGFQVIAGLKESESEGYLPVLAITAQPTHKLRALQDGAKDFISKPFDMAEVLLRVRNMLEVRLLHKRAADLNKFKTSLVSIVSHELGNALTIIGSGVFILQDQLPPAYADGSDRIFAMIHANIDALNMASQNLLNMGRLEAGKLAIDFKPTDVAEILRGALNRVQLLCANKNLHVSTDFPEGLQLLRADPDSLTLVVSNLLSNAIKYTPEHGRIVIGLHPDNARPGSYRVSVQDSGIGVSEEDRPKILTGHYRSQNGKNMTVQGYGVGLSLAQQIVAAHGSTIEIEGGPGKGSRFSFLLSSTGIE